MTTDWRHHYLAVIASDVSSRDGLGWEFTTSDGRSVWAVFRNDGGLFPVFSASRGEAPRPQRDELVEMTTTAVADLLAAAGLADDVGWITQNIAAALVWAGEDVTGWEGEEWALESDSEDAPVAWASSGDGRMPFAWLRALSPGGARSVGVYQDDVVFGLDFTERLTRELPSYDQGSLRSRRDLPLANGAIRSVEVVYDTTVEGGQCPGLVTEVLLHTDGGALLLLAAEAYGVNEWHLYDESVVVVPDAGRAHAMTWMLARQPWRSTEAPDLRL